MTRRKPSTGAPAARVAVRRAPPREATRTDGTPADPTDPLGTALETPLARAIAATVNELPLETLLELAAVAARRGPYDARRVAPILWALRGAAVRGDYEWLDAKDGMRALAVRQLRKTDAGYLAGEPRDVLRWALKTGLLDENLDSAGRRIPLDRITIDIVASHTLAMVFSSMASGSWPTAKSPRERVDADLMVYGARSHALKVAQRDNPKRRTPTDYLRAILVGAGFDKAQVKDLLKAV